MYFRVKTTTSLKKAYRRLNIKITGKIMHLLSIKTIYKNIQIMETQVVGSS
jgi:hypothetical protein